MGEQGTTFLGLPREQLMEHQQLTDLVGTGTKGLLIIMAPDAKEDFVQEVGSLFPANPAIQDVFCEQKYDRLKLDTEVNHFTNGKITEAFSGKDFYNVNMAVVVMNVFASGWRNQPLKTTMCFDRQRCQSMLFVGVQRAMQGPSFCGAMMHYNLEKTVLAAFVQNLGTEPLDMLACVRSMYTKGTEWDADTYNVTVPCFEVTTKVDLKQEYGLDNVSMPCVSDKETVLEVLQQTTTIKCNEFGTSAVSATAFLGGTRSGPPKHISIDGPFTFLVLHVVESPPRFVPLFVAVVDSVPPSREPTRYSGR